MHDLSHLLQGFSDQQAQPALSITCLVRQFLPGGSLVKLISCSGHADAEVVHAGPPDLEAGRAGNQGDSHGAGRSCLPSVVQTPGAEASAPPALPEPGQSSHQPFFSDEGEIRVVCNLRAHIQHAPDFLRHERVYHPQCTFGPAATADIDDSVNDPGRFAGCLLFTDRNAADALHQSHQGVKQIAVVSCPPPEVFSIGHAAIAPAEGSMLAGLVRMVFRSCDRLRTWPDNLDQCTSLRTLVVDSCRNFQSSSSLRSESLQCLVLRACPKLWADLKLSRRKLPKLELCVVRNCSALSVIIDAGHTALRQLVVGSVSALKQMVPHDRSAGMLEGGRGGDMGLVLPVSLKKFGYEHSNSPCPKLQFGAVRPPDVSSAAGGTAQEETLKLMGLSYHKHRPLLISQLPASPQQLGLLQQLDVIGCAALNQVKFVSKVLADMTRLEQLRASLNFEQVCFSGVDL